MILSSNDKKTTRQNGQHGLIYRAMGNLRLNGVPIFWIRLSPNPASGDWITDAGTLRSQWRLFSRSWRYRVANLSYAAVLSAGETGRTPHMHIIATSPPPDDCPLALHCVPVGSTDRDIKKVSRYALKNLRQPTPFTSQQFSRSMSFYRWGNPAIWHIFRGSLDVYGQVATKPTLFAEGAPPLRKCQMCDNHLPETLNYFNRDGSRLRHECWQCWQYRIRANDANRRAAAIGASGTLTWQAVRDLVISARGRERGQWIDYWTKRQISRWSLDHIEPLSRGGSNSISNLCVTAPETNSSKADKPLGQWLAELGARGIRHELQPPDQLIQQPLMLEGVA